MKPACPTELELARAIGSDTDDELTSHIETCESCRELRDGFERAIAAARRLPVDMPTPIERDHMRATVIAETMSIARSMRAAPRLAAGTLPPPVAARSSRKPALSLIALGVALAASIAAWIAPSGSTPEDHRVAEPTAHTHGTVRGRPGARFTITQAPDEVVRLEHGVIDVDVAPLHPGERFRVAIGDAEIEVRGTSFVVTAETDRLQSVAVHHGRVEVRPSGQATTTLVAGQAWRSRVAGEPEPTEVAIEGPAPPRKPHVARAVVAPEPERTAAPGIPAGDGPSAPPPARSPEELAYEEAWTAMRAGNFARASAAFARVFLLAPDGALAEDAGFWRAVALARGHRAGVATTAFRDFLRAHPRAGRAGEASAMLGWLLVDARAYDEAEQRFRAAANDANPAVRASARDGLAAVTARTR